MHASVNVCMYTDKRDRKIDNCLFLFPFILIRKFIKTMSNGTHTYPQIHQ